jgi:hypothetical protein
MYTVSSNTVVVELLGSVEACVGPSMTASVVAYVSCELTSLHAMCKLHLAPT